MGKTAVYKPRMEAGIDPSLNGLRRKQPCQYQDPRLPPELQENKALVFKTLQSLGLHYVVLPTNPKVITQGPSTQLRAQALALDKSKFFSRSL